MKMLWIQEYKVYMFVRWKIGSGYACEKNNGKADNTNSLVLNSEVKKIAPFNLFSL